MKMAHRKVFLYGFPAIAIIFWLSTGCSGSSEESDGGNAVDGPDGDGFVDGLPGDIGDAGDDGPDAGDPGADQAPDGGGDEPADSGPDGGGDEGDEDGPEIIGSLEVDCDVPFVLDASRVTEMGYMTQHFDDLVQDYCIVTSVGGVDLTSYGEKMYYGSHSAAGTLPEDVVLSLNQQSMTGMLSPAYSVRVDFAPDTAVVADSEWTVGVEGETGEALAIVVEHQSLSEMCLFAIGYSGNLSFSDAVDVTQVEGGSFAVSGSMQMVDPEDVPGICAIFESVLPCCP